MNFTLPLSEHLAAAIRDQDLEAVQRMGPAAACMEPLLRALGWRTLSHEVVEALPYFSSRLEFTDLLNMLAVLEIDSDEIDVDTTHLDQDLLPCLLVHSQGAYVLLGQDERGVEFFDAQRRDYFREPLSLKGRGYVFTDRHATHAVVEGRRGEWFTSLVLRFKRLLKHLLAITALLNLTALAVPVFIMNVYDGVIGTHSTEALPALILGMAFVIFVEFGLRLTRARTLGLIASRLDYLIGVETFRQIVSLPPLLAERSSVAAQLATLKQFDSVREFINGPTAALVLETPFIVLLIGVMWIIAGPLALVPIAMLLAYGAFGFFYLPTMKRSVMTAGAARTIRQSLVMESLNGLRELKAIGAERVWLERCRETSANTLLSLFKASVSQSIVESATHLLMTVSGVMVLGIGALSVMDGDLSVGALIATMALTWRVLGPVQGLFHGYIQFDQILAGIRTINQLMKLKTEPAFSKAGLFTQGLQGGIQFDRVSFRYGPNADPALLGASFEIQPREFVALLGDNGSGKSTLLKLIAGVYTAQSGNVYIDGVDSRQFNPIDLRRLVAYLPQSPFLFHGSIAQNMRFKNSMATQADLERAADEAGILEAVRELPEGFETRVGDHATKRLPTGLIRGLCLARAFVRPAPIVLLDEPGTSLDNEADQALMQHIGRLKLNHTVVMSSHRPSHIRMADRAIVVKRGAVVFVGDPEQALRMQ